MGNGVIYRQLWTAIRFFEVVHITHFYLLFMETGYLALIHSFCSLDCPGRRLQAMLYMFYITRSAFVSFKPLTFLLHPCLPRYGYDYDVLGLAIARAYGQ